MVNRMKRIVLMLFSLISLSGCEKLEMIQDITQPEYKKSCVITVEHKDSRFIVNGKNYGSDDGHGVVYIHLNCDKDLEFYRISGTFTNVTIIQDNRYAIRYQNIRFLYIPYYRMTAR